MCGLYTPIVSKIIRHTGIVDSIGQGSVVVRIVQSSACAACHAAHLCRSAESKERLLTVQTDEGADFAVGQQVQIEGTVKKGLNAVLLAYVMPLVLILSAMMIATSMGVSEPMSALIAMGVLISYGTVLWLLRHTLQRRFAFTIKPQQTVY